MICGAWMVNSPTWPRGSSRAGLRIHDAHVHIGQGQAGGARLVGGVDGADDGRQHGLGHAVGFQQPAAGQFSKRCFVSCISGAAPDQHTFMDLKSTSPAFTLGWLSRAMNRVGTPCRHDGPHFLECGYQVVHIARVGDYRGGPSGDQSGVQGHVAINVEDGHDPGEDVVPVCEHGGGVGVKLHGRYQRAMGAQGSLGGPRRAAAEEQDGTVLRPTVTGGGPLPACFCSRSGIRKSPGASSMR